MVSKGPQYDNKRKQEHIWSRELYTHLTNNTDPHTNMTDKQIEIAMNLIKEKNIDLNFDALNHSGGVD